MYRESSRPKEVKINKQAKEDLPRYLGCFGPRPIWSESLYSSKVDIAEEEDKFDSEFLPRALPPQFSFPASDEAYVVVGPVIGMTTNRTSRIMIVTSKPCKVKLEIHGTNELRRKFHHVTVEEEVPSTNPFVFKIDRLKPNYRYSVSLSIPVYNLVNCEFTTLARNLIEKDFNFAVVSGNTVHSLKQSTQYRGRHDGSQIPLKTRSKRHPVNIGHVTHATTGSLWKDLYEKVCRREIDYVFHVGNNITLGGFEDPEYSIFAKMAKMDDDQKTEACLSNVYKSVWNEPWTKHVLANVPNIMVADEQDVGDLVEIHDEEAYADHDVARLAKLYWQRYQRSTWMDFNENDNEDDRTFRTSHGILKLSPEIGVAILDWRTHLVTGSILEDRKDFFYKKHYKKDFSRSSTLTEEDGVPYNALGLDQKRDIERGLQETLKWLPTENKRCKALLVISPVSLTSPDAIIRDIGYGHEADFVLDEIAKWKLAGENREAVILSAVEHHKPKPGANLVEVESNKILQVMAGPISNSLRQLNNYATLRLTQKLKVAPEFEHHHTYLDQYATDLVDLGRFGQLLDQAYLQNFKPGMIVESPIVTTKHKSFWRLITGR